LLPEFKRYGYTCICFLFAQVHGQAEANHNMNRIAQLRGEYVTIAQMVVMM